MVKIWNVPFHFTRRKLIEELKSLGTIFHWRFLTVIAKVNRKHSGILVLYIYFCMGQRFTKVVHDKKLNIFNILKNKSTGFNTLNLVEHVLWRAYTKLVKGLGEKDW